MIDIKLTTSKLETIKFKVTDEQLGTVTNFLASYFNNERLREITDRRELASFYHTLNTEILFNLLDNLNHNFNPTKRKQIFQTSPPDV